MGFWSIYESWSGCYLVDDDADVLNMTLFSSLSAQ